MTELYIKKPFFHKNDGFIFGKTYNTNIFSNKSKKNNRIKKIFLIFFIKIIYIYNYSNPNNNKTYKFNYGKVLAIIKIT